MRIRFFGAESPLSQTVLKELFENNFSDKATAQMRMSECIIILNKWKRALQFRMRKASTHRPLSKVNVPSQSRLASSQHCRSQVAPGLSVLRDLAVEIPGQYLFAASRVNRIRTELHPKIVSAFSTLPNDPPLISTLKPWPAMVIRCGSDHSSSTILTVGYCSSKISFLFIRSRFRPCQMSRRLTMLGSDGRCRTWSVNCPHIPLVSRREERMSHMM
jgi:hypothetical protein